MRSGNNVYLYGEAGTGKSFVLQEFIKSLPEDEYERTIVAAPTGIVAINVGGATLHRIFKIPITLLSPHKPIRIPATLDAVKRIIIDEYSMMRFDVFNYVSRIILKAQERNDEKIQVIVVGDALQLPPVIKEEDYETLYKVWRDIIPEIEHGYPFIHPNWKKFNFVDCHLTEIVRQGGDQELIENENLARLGKRTCLTWFANNTASEKIEGAIHICPHNKTAEAINNAKCRKFDE